MVWLCQSSSAVSEHLVPVGGAVWEGCGIFRRQTPTEGSESLREGLEIFKASPTSCSLCALTGRQPGQPAFCSCHHAFLVLQIVSLGTLGRMTLLLASNCFLYFVTMSNITKCPISQAGLWLTMQPWTWTSDPPGSTCNPELAPCNAEGHTQGFTYARQALCHWVTSHAIQSNSKNFFNL